MAQFHLQSPEQAVTPARSSSKRSPVSPWTAEAPVELSTETRASRSTSALTTAFSLWHNKEDRSASCLWPPVKSSALWTRAWSISQLSSRGQRLRPTRGFNSLRTQSTVARGFTIRNTMPYLLNGTMDWEILMLRTPRDSKATFYSHSGKLPIIQMQPVKTYIAKANQQVLLVTEPPE